MSPESKNSAITIALEQQREDERVRDVQISVEQMFLREEQTVDFVLGCLYDIGSANLIEKKVPLRLLKPPLRSIARFSRPAFRFVAVRWFHKNCPAMITDWLHSLVVFEPPEPESEADKALATVDIDAIEARSAQVELALAVQQKEFEVTRLEHQLRVTTLVAVTLAALFGSATLWLGYELRQIRAADVEPARPVLETSVTAP
ncbi:MAG: hypothetical protein ACFB9N_16110 [Geitlerinemataceae cyanobacterium]